MKKFFFISLLLFISLYSLLFAEWKSIGFEGLNLDDHVEIEENIIYVQNENFIFRCDTTKENCDWESMKIPENTNLVKVENFIIYCKSDEAIYVFCDGFLEELKLEEPFTEEDFKVFRSNFYVKNCNGRILKCDKWSSELKWSCLSEEYYDKLIKVDETNIYVSKENNYFQINTWYKMTKKIDPKIACGYVENNYCIYQKENSELQLCYLRGSEISDAQILAYPGLLKNGIFVEDGCIYVQQNTGEIYKFNIENQERISLGNETFARLLGVCGSFVYAQGMDGLIYKWVD